jgi:circadian clock protein KaiC
MDIVERIREKDPTTTAKSLVASIREHVAALNAQRLVIDPTTPLASLKDVQILREYQSFAMSIKREIGTTNIITTEIPPGSGATSRYGAEEFPATGVYITGIAKAAQRAYYNHWRTSKIYPVTRSLTGTPFLY